MITSDPTRRRGPKLILVNGNLRVDSTTGSLDGGAEAEVLRSPPSVTGNAVEAAEGETKPTLKSGPGDGATQFPAKQRQDGDQVAISDRASLP